jgi:ABC-type sugar transport system ATPase subunit
MAYGQPKTDPLAKSFAKPPESAKPWVYWFWLNGNMTREGITADLEAMKRAGIRGVLIMEVDQGAPVGKVPAGAEGRPVVYGLRPEHIRIDPQGVPTEVVVVEPTGSETQVVLRIGGKDTGGKEIVAVFKERLTAKPGETLAISPTLANAHLFDAETGRRLVA